MKILVLGASGMIGHRIFLETRKLWSKNVYALIRKSKAHYESYSLFQDNTYDEHDLGNWSKTEKLLNELQPSWIINAAGITIRKPEISDLSRALEINSFLPQRLSKWAESHHARVIHMSTDCVFKGDLGCYTETSQPSAVDHYGRTKFLGEIGGVNALTFRFSCIGRELDSHTELLDWFLAQEGKKIKGFRKAIYSGLTTQKIASEVVNVIKNYPTLSGLFQLSSTPISKYDLLCLIKDKFGVDVEISPSDDYVSDKTLICKRYSDLTGFKPSSWANMVEELEQDKEISYKRFKRS